MAQKKESNKDVTVRDLTPKKDAKGGRRTNIQGGGASVAGRGGASASGGGASLAGGGNASADGKGGSLS